MRGLQSSVPEDRNPAIHFPAPTFGPTWGLPISTFTTLDRRCWEFLGTDNILYTREGNLVQWVWVF